MSKLIDEFTNLPISRQAKYHRRVRSQPQRNKQLSVRREYQRLWDLNRRQTLEKLGICKQCGRVEAHKNRLFCFRCLFNKSRPAVSVKGRRSF